MVILMVILVEFCPAINKTAEQAFDEQTFDEQTFGEQTFDEQTFGEQTFGEQTFAINALLICCESVGHPLFD